MHVILCESAYYNSNWCKQILQGLSGELKKRRMEYQVVFSAERMEAAQSYFIIGSDYKWMSAAVRQANGCGIVPILIFNQRDHIIGGKYHSVSSDIAGSVHALLQWLAGRGKTRVCLYGVNPESVSDISRNLSYCDILTAGHTFYNNGSLLQCFDSFQKSGERFDAVICTNDYAAISFVKNLMRYDADALRETEVLSCSQSSISAYFADCIKSVNINLTSLGINAFQLDRLVQRGENISEISLTVRWDMEFGGEAASMPREEEILPSTSFYEDTELTELMHLDRRLDSLDETDRQIIAMLLGGQKYADIADACHISEQSVKYRVKQYGEICHVKNRSELIGLLREYRIEIH